MQNKALSIAFYIIESYNLKPKNYNLTYKRLSYYLYMLNSLYIEKYGKKFFIEDIIARDIPYIRPINKLFSHKIRSNIYPARFYNLEDKLIEPETLTKQDMDFIDKALAPYHRKDEDVFDGLKSGYNYILQYNKPIKEYDFIAPYRLKKRRKSNKGNF